ncbi:MAG: tetratricopeptide repeat protein, partial [Deltaproteobacteria bacterium]|nr:tetratricopeptide repeat protein [Deltaproteobacteria bacterium]
MFIKLSKIFSLYLILSITFSFSILKGQDQGQGRIRSPEIIFLGKEETKWTEEREVSLPIIAAQGIKEEPSSGSFDLKEGQIGPMKKMSPSTTQPGCAYTSRLTRGMTSGDTAFYERGRYHYLQGNYEDAIQLFRRLLEGHPESLLKGSAIYWMGEARFHQEKTEEAFSFFRRVVEEYPDNEFAPHALYSCGWIQLIRGAFEEGRRFFRLAYDKNPALSIAQSSLFP